MEGGIKEGDNKQRRGRTVFFLSQKMRNEFSQSMARQPKKRWTFFHFARESLAEPFFYLFFFFSFGSHARSVAEWMNRSHLTNTTSTTMMDGKAKPGGTR
jgi:hypothetical protein